MAVVDVRSVIFYAEPLPKMFAELRDHINLNTPK